MWRECEREGCSASLPIGARADMRFCSPRCRTAVSRARSRKSVPAPVENLPETPTCPEQATSENPQEFPVRMTAAPRWIRRTANKVPLSATGGTATSTDPDTWASYDDASESTAGTGLGYVLVGDGVGCIDLDHCLVDGHPTPAVAEFLSTLPETFVEISMSGDGLHVWGTGVYLTSRKLRGEIAGEVIGSKKYVAVTGRRFRDAPLRLANIAEPVASILKT